MHAQFDSISIDPEDLTCELISEEEENDDGQLETVLRIIVEPGFRLNIVLHVKDDPALAFSTIHIDVTNLKLTIRGEQINILFSAPDFNAVGDVTQAATRQAALNASGLSEAYLLGLETALKDLMTSCPARSQSVSSPMAQHEALRAPKTLALTHWAVRCDSNPDLACLSSRPLER